MNLWRVLTLPLHRLRAAGAGATALLCSALMLLATPAWAGCGRWSTTATTPVVANGVATSAINVTYDKNGTFAVTVTITGSARFNNGLQTYTQNVTKNSPINITATDTTVETVTVTQTSSTCTQSKTISFVRQGPTVSTGFSPASIAVNGTSTKTITLTNPNSVAITGVAFSDTFPAGLRNVSPVNTTNSCGGTLTALAAGNSLVLSGGTIPANGSCSVTSVVTASTAGNKTNTTGAVTSSNAAPGASASAVLNVAAVSAALSTVDASPASIAADGISTSTLTVTLRDGAGSPVAGQSVAIARSSSAGNTITASVNSDASGIATFTVTGTTAQTVTYTATAAGTTITDTAQVVFNAASGISKNFSPGTVAVNGTSTLSVVFTNTSGNNLGSQSFTDTYPAGLVNATPLQTTNSCGGTLTASAGGNSLGLSGATVPKKQGNTNGSCIVTVAVRPTTAGSLVNTVSGTPGSASATLTALAISTANSTVDASPTSVAANGTTASTITVTLKDGASNGVSGKVVQLTAGSGSSVISTVSGTTNASGVATFTVTDAVDEGPITYTARDVTDNITLTDTAQVSFTPLSAPTVQKTFTPSTIADAGQSTLRITLTNPNATPVNGASFTDTYPAGIVNDAPLVITNTCGGVNPGTVAGGSVLDLVGGTIPAAGSCFVSVVVTTTTFTAGASVGLTNSSGPVTSLNTLDGASASAMLTTIAIDPALSTAVASPTTLEADGTTTSTITVTMVDGAGVGVSDLDVSLTASGGTSLITGPTSTNGIRTDDNGQVTFTVKASTPQTVTYTARSTSNGINVTQQPQVVFTAPQSTVTAITCATACAQTSATSTVSWNVTFNRAVTNVTSTAFSLVATGLTGSAITSVTGSGTNWVVTANVGSGAGTLGLNQSGPGSVSPTLTGTFTGQVYTTPTLVTAITCATACTQTSITPTVSWNVTFNRSVTNVDASAFTLVASGLSGAAITSVTGSGTSWTVTANVGTGAGTLGLNQSGPGAVSPALSGTFTGQVYTTPATVVTAISCATSCTQTSVTGTVSWNVTFNRNVSGVSAAAFTLVPTGLSGSAITSVTGSGTSWTVTANVGTGVGTLGLNQTGPGVVLPTLTGTFTGEVYTTPTLVTAISCATACSQTAITISVSWNVTFNRSVTGVDASVFSLAATGLTGSAITSVTGSGTSWTVTANVGTGAGTLGLNQSGPGSVSPVLGGTFSGEVYTTPATVVTAITCATSCTQTAVTGTVSWNVSFNRSVSGVDASAFSLAATGLTGSSITSVTGSGTSWTVTASVGTGVGTLGLNQSGPGSVSPVLTGTFTGQVYTTPTLVTAITCATACVQTTITTSVSWNVTFNRSVSSVDATAFSLVASGLTGSAITSVTGSGTSWTVTADVGTGAGTLGLNQTGPGSVTPVLGGTFTGQVYTTPPTVVTAITCAAACVQTAITTSVSWNVTFNRSVSGVDATAFGLAATGLTGSAITSVTGSGTSWVVTADVGTGAGTLGLNQTGPGSVSPVLTGTFTGEVYTTPATVVTAITCATACVQTAITTSVSWNVTFNRTVSGVDATAFGLAATGLTGSAITSVTGSGTTWTVTADVGTGAGTLGLNQTGPGSVSPVLTGTFSGEVYTTPATVVTAITCATACVQAAITTSVSWNVTFNRSVSGVDASAFGLAATGLTGSAITSVTGSGTSWTVTADVGTGAGTLGLNQTGPGSVSPVLTGTLTGEVYSTPATVVTAITCATACVQTAITTSVSWNVTFNRNVSGVDATAFSLTATGLTGSAITSVTGSGTSWVVTADVGSGAGTLGLNQTGPGSVSPVLTGTFNGEVYTTPATVVTAITCVTTCVQTTITSSVSWNVTFNRSVSGVDASAFGLAASGLTGSAITSVTGSGTTWTVTADVGTGAGTLGLNQTGPGSVSPVLTGTFNGEVYTTPATVVTAISCATACVQTTITTSVSWNVSFNRSVSGVDASAFGLAATGLTGSAITSVTGSGTTWTVTADVGTGAGTLGLNQTGPGTVSPVLTGTFIGEVYTTPATVVTAITCTTACVQTAITTSVSWNVTFNRTVSGVDATAFGLAATGLTGSAITSVTGSGTTWTVTADVGTGAGTLGLNQTGPGSVSPVLTGTFNGEVYTTPATVVTAITCATACVQTTITTSVSWNVTFNRNVSGVDATAFSLAATGLTGSAITSVTGSGTTWTVTADVGTGAGTLGLNQTGPGSVSPVLTGTFTGEVYTTPATVVTAITCATACVQTTITTSVSWNVTFNRGVSGVDATAFGLAATGLTGSAITSVTGSGTTWTVTADVGTGAGTLGLNQTGPGSVSPVLTSTFTGEVYTTPATVVTAITCATACVQTTVTASVSWNVTFNRDVSGVDATVFSLSTSGISGSVITAVTGSGTTWTVTADVGTGAGSIGLNQTGPGSVSPVLTGTFTGEVYTTPDTIVTAISCTASCTQALTTSAVSWEVTFNRSVTGVDATAFTLVSNGMTGVFISSVTGSGATWTVTANLGVGSGTLGLDQISAGGISPALTGTFTGDVYTLLTASTLALYRFDEASWTGGAGQVADSSGNGYNAQAVNGATTAAASPASAIATDPGSCRYGVMTASSVTNGYVRTTLPNLSTDFTVAGWIRSTNAATPNQRILADDAAGATGYGFSLGDGGAGKLRFYNRDLGADANFDSGYVLQSDTWYFVAAVADIAGGQRSIYVFSASGALLSASSAPHAAGTWGVDAGSVTIGAAQGQYFKGYLDEIQIYPRVLSEAALASLATETHACPVISGPDHFQISHGGTGVTCAASAVTLSAHNADHSMFPGYTGTVALSTSVGRGDWTLLSGSGSLANGTDNDGAATYSFGGPDNGTVTLGFQNTTAETLSLNAEDGGLRETGGSADAATDDPPITFATSGFEFRADGVANDIGTQIAGKSSAVSPGAQSLQIRAIKSSDSSTACVAALQGTRTVQFAHECVSPASCSAATLRVNGGNSTAVAGNSAGSVSTYTNTVMSFDADGVASFSFAWDDAGSGRLHARYPLPLPSGAPSGSFMAGASNAFVSRPFAYHLSVTGNPAASTAGGSRFIAAGTSFEGSARAVVWSGADDSNNDGVADGMESGDTNATNNADLSDNATTPNFSPAASITLNSSLLLPAGGAHPGITGSPVATFTNGLAAISGMRYDEAGIIEISAVQGGSYLGLGAPETAKIRGTSGYVGRFHPERFGVAANAPVFTNACAAGAFTYQGQPFHFGTAPALSLTALSAQGTTTANYTTEGFFKLTSTLAGRSYTDATGGTRTLTVVNRGGITLSGSSDGTGTATVSLVAGSGGDAFTYARAAPEAPFAASVTANFTAADLTDGDGVCLDTLDDGVCDTFSINALSGANMRYGRLVADNAMGSELDALRVPLYAQYLSGSGFLLNAADVCSVIPASALDFGVGTPSGLPAAGVLTFPVGTGNSTASFTGTPIAGQFGLILSAPGSGKIGEISLQVNLGTAALPWLQYDWNGDGSHTDDPMARATFGTFQGPKRVVFKREVW